jgi:uncharacterized membrane protein YeaQ/YmgE (transglycosylase-associated protein family)
MSPDCGMNGQVAIDWIGINVSWDEVVPEFGFIGLILAICGALIVIIVRR